MLSIIILLGVIFVLAYWQVSSFIGIPAVGVVLVTDTFLKTIDFPVLIVFWTIYSVFALFCILKPFRRILITNRLLPLLKKRLPPMSDTEREAIEAGNVWWEKELFCGRPDWQSLLNLKLPALSNEEKEFLNNEVETLCAMLDDWEIVSKRHDLSKQVWDYLKSERFLGMVIPKEYGGRGFSALAHSTVVMKIATRSISAAVDAMVPNSLGPAELILHYGTREQKNEYLPKLARGEEIPCFALTAPEAGSDAGSLHDSGIICKGIHEGKEVIGIRLNWDKRYITLAPVATVIGLAVKLYDPDHLIGQTLECGITLCLVPAHHPGVETGHRHLPLHLGFMNGPTRGKDVFIPLEWVIGGVSRIGEGWKMLMESLSIGRAISLPALSVAYGKLTYLRTGAYARLRRQFNTSISNFEGIGEALGHIAGLTYTMEATRLMTAAAVDLKIRPSVASAIAKYHLTESARKVVSHGMDVHAGHMIQVGPRNYLAHAHLAIPVSITVEGANILTRSLIIFGQGAIRCHPYIYQEMQLLSHPQPNTEALDTLLFSHIGYTFSNIVRVLWTGFTGGLLLFSPIQGPHKRYYKQLTRMSMAMAFLSDISMVLLGGGLKRRELISARLGDILSQLYMASAVLKYFHDQGSPQTDLESVRWSVENALYEIQVACDDLLQNYPMKRLGKVFLRMIFPYGRAYHKPKDELTHQIVGSMLAPSSFRDRLTQYCFTPKKEEDPAKKMEKAFATVEMIEPLMKKIQQALRAGKLSPLGSFQDQLQAAVKSSIVTKEESDQLAAFDALYQDIIKVDEFSFDLKPI